MAKKRSTLDKKYTKTQIAEHIAESTELTKAQINSVLDSLGEIIDLHIKKRSVGEFVLPGILKITTTTFSRKDGFKALVFDLHVIARQGNPRAVLPHPLAAERELRLGFRVV